MPALSPEQLERVLDVYGRLVERRVRTHRDMTAAQYARIAVDLYARAPSRFLVFGCGEDSVLWTTLNREGRTLFLEDQGEWAEKSRQAGLEVRDVAYVSRLGVWMNSARAPDGMDEALIETPWDLVLVDGPVGHGQGPGREQSIYAAALLRRGRPTRVYVHDLERPWERACADKHLGEPSGRLDNLAWWEGGRG